MPTTNSSLQLDRLRAFLEDALAPYGSASRGIFSKRELSAAWRLLQEGGVQPEEVRLLLRVVQDRLLSERLHLGLGRRRRLHGLLDRLVRAGHLPDRVPAPEAGSDWVGHLMSLDPEALAESVEPEPVEPEPVEPEPVEPEPVEPEPEPEPTALDVETLWAHCRSGVESRPPDLSAALLSGLKGDLAQIPTEGPGKLDGAAAFALAAWLLREVDLPATSLEGLRPLCTEAAGPAQPLLREVLRGSLEHHGLSGLPDAPEGAEDLVAAFERLRDEQPTIQVGHWQTRIDHNDALVYLQGLCFCRHGEAWDNVQSGHAAFADIHPGGAGLDEVERTTFAAALRDYIEGSGTTVFQYGLWKGQAGKAAGVVRNREAVAPWALPDGSLAQDPPRLGGLLLLPAQATWLAGNLDLVRDTQAARRLQDGLVWASALLSGRQTPAPTTFALFTRVHDLLRNRAEASEDGRLDYSGLMSELRASAGRLPERLLVLTNQLRATPARWGRVELGETGAARMTEVLASHVRSDRALDSLEEALVAWCTGALDAPAASQLSLDDEAFAGFADFLQGYLDTWPHLQVFDFNKLGRMALAERTKDPVPLCRLNSEERDPGTFHVTVGTAVMEAMAHVDLPQAWMKRRFGYRAKQCIELVDLLAEQQSRGLGPLPALFSGHSDTRVRVVATTSDLFYNLLVFGHEVPGEPVRWLYLDSAGQLTERRRPEDKHRLFEAVLDAGGHLDVQVPERLSTSVNAYPIQNPYGLGDRIDVELFDKEAEENQTAKERFETRYRVVQGTVIAYDVHGNYTVSMASTGEGDEEPGGSERILDYEAIRKMNNPHYVDEYTGTACSTRYRLRSDGVLAEDLDTMAAIAQRTGLLEFDLALSEVALARVQKTFLAELNAFTSHTMRYPRKPPADDKDRHYWDDLNLGTNDAHDYIECERGVCRHMFIREHMGKQRGGIDERFASGAANTYGGDFRGLHIWGEVTLADKARLGHDNPEPRDTRYLSDATWKDPYVPLWEGAYGNDARRVEMYNRTNYRSHLVVRG